MNRRSFIRACGFGTIGILSGCVEVPPQQTTELKPDLGISATVDQSNDVWELTAVLAIPSDTALHDVKIFAFSSDGTEVCRNTMGDLEGPGDNTKEVTTPCEGFPAVISATAAESVCDEADIEIIYWIGDEDDRGSSGENEKMLWERTYRKCNENLPPERVIKKMSSTDTVSNG